jgi:SAM-dependent methyltransferase
LIETVEANFYDFPKYYDLVYGSDWKAEFAFLGACFEKHALGTVQSLYEPACGTGRLLVKFASAGYVVGGNDLNGKQIAYCNARLARKGFSQKATVGDMADFRLDRRVDAAFNMINSFRHLQSEAQASQHLQCMADALRPGGLYILGLHLTPTRGKPIEEESWAARRGNLAVMSRIWVIAHHRRKRQEVVGMSYDIYTPTKQLRITDQTLFRTYTRKQMLSLIDRTPEFEITSVYDFGYDIHNPIQLDPHSEDSVFVLRKKG